LTAALLAACAAGHKDHGSHKGQDFKDTKVWFHVTSVRWNAFRIGVSIGMSSKEMRFFSRTTKNNFLEH
jgi:hypothetical protein